MATRSKKLLINSLEGVPHGATVLRQAQHERENRRNFVFSFVRPELVEACPEPVEGGEDGFINSF